MPKGRQHRRPGPPPTPDWVPAPPDGSTQLPYYTAGNRVWFYNLDTGYWEGGLVVNVPGVSGSTLRPFVQVDATEEIIEIGAEYVRLQGAQYAQYTN